MHPLTGWSGYKTNVSRSKERQTQVTMGNSTLHFHPWIDKLCRKSTKNYTANLQHTPHEQIGMYRTLHPTVPEYTFFSLGHGTFSIGVMLGYKNSLSKFLKTEIMVHIFSDHSGMHLKTDNSRNS